MKKYSDKRIEKLQNKILRHFNCENKYETGEAMIVLLQLVNSLMNDVCIENELTSQEREDYWKVIIDALNDLEISNRKLNNLR